MRGSWFALPTCALQENLSLVPKVLGWKPGWGEQFPLVFLRLGENLPGKPRPGLRYQGWSWVPHLGRNWQYHGFPRDITHGLETLATTLATNLRSSWALSDLASDYSTLYKQCCLGLHHLLNFLSKCHRAMLNALLVSSVELEMSCCNWRVKAFARFSDGLHSQTGLAEQT